VGVETVVANRRFVRGSLTELASEVCKVRIALADRLTAIVASRSQQEDIAGRSYWHHNGFTKLVLDHDARWGQVRVHVWPGLPTADDIHGHAWYYASIVLAGELSEVTYREARQRKGQPMWRHSYVGVGNRQFAFIDPHPVNLVEVTEPVARRGGDTSGGSPSHIHRFVASQAPAATLLRVGPVLRRSSHVYRLTAEPPQIVAPRPTTPTEVREWAAYLAASI
jgi:hypothetical protein